MGEISNRPLTILNSSEWNIASRSTNATSTNRNHILFQRANNTSAVTANFNLGGIAMSGYDGSNYGYGWNGGAEISAFASQTWTAANRGTYLTFGTTADNTASVAERMRIASNGSVGINSTNPTSKLEVVGPSSTTYDAVTWTDDFETNKGWSVTGDGSYTSVRGAITADCPDGTPNTCITGAPRGGSNVWNLKVCTNDDIAQFERAFLVGSGGGTFSGFYKMGTEDCNCDRFEYSVNNSGWTIIGPAGTYCRDTWTAFSFTVPAGPSIVRLKYDTDGGTRERGSKVIIDDVQLTNVLEASTPTTYAANIQGDVNINGSLITNCRICMGWSDSDRDYPEKISCMNLTPNATMPKLNMDGDVNGDDSFFMWFECP